MLNACNFNHHPVSSCHFSTSSNYTVNQDTSQKTMAGQAKQKNNTAVSTATKSTTSHSTTRRSTGKASESASQKQQQRPKIEEIEDEDEDDEDDDEGDEEDSDDSDESDSDMEDIAGKLCLFCPSYFDPVNKLSPDTVTHKLYSVNTYRPREVEDHQGIWSLGKSKDQRPCTIWP